MTNAQQLDWIWRSWWRQRGALPRLQRDQDLNPVWYRERGKVCTWASSPPDGWNTDKVWQQKIEVEPSHATIRGYSRISSTASMRDRGSFVGVKVELIQIWMSQSGHWDWMYMLPPSVNVTLVHQSSRLKNRISSTWSWCTKCRRRHNRKNVLPFLLRLVAQDFNVWMNEGDMTVRGDTVGKAVGTLSNLATGVRTSDTM